MAKKNIARKMAKARAPLAIFLTAYIFANI